MAAAMTERQSQCAMCGAVVTFDSRRVIVRNDSHGLRELLLGGQFVGIERTRRGDVGGLFWTTFCSSDCAACGPDRVRTQADRSAVSDHVADLCGELAKTDAGQFWLVTLNRLICSGAELSDGQAGAVCELLEYSRGLYSDQVRNVILRTIDGSAFADDPAEA